MPAAPPFPPGPGAVRRGAGARAPGPVAGLPLTEAGGVTASSAGPGQPPAAGRRRGAGRPGAPGHYGVMAIATGSPATVTGFSGVLVAVRIGVTVWVSGLAT